MALSVMMTGTMRMHLLSAHNWDSLLMVSITLAVNLYT